MPWKPLDEHDSFATLGWYVLDWIQENLTVYDGPTIGEPLALTQEQANFVLRLYEVDPKFEGPATRPGERHMRRGRLVRRALLSRPKGHGKSPLVAALCLVEALADVVMDGWDANGQPVGRPWHDIGLKPLVQIVAVSEDQPLALDTPVRTPNGWTTIGQIEAGEQVFDSRGEAVTVARTTPVFTDLDCYEVTFDDGAQIVCSANHGWTVDRAHSRGHRTETMTTEQMADHLARGLRQAQLRIPLVAQQGETANLPIPPYLLGLWLGDGTTGDASIAFNWDDLVEELALIKECVEPWETVTVRRWRDTRSALMRVKRKDGICPRGHDYSEGSPNRTIYSGFPACRKCCSGSRLGRREPILPTLRERLRSAGLLGNKHIPQQYLYASYEQRMELLRGLVDSDGCISTKGQAHFVNADVELFDQVCELLTTLGFRWYVTRSTGRTARLVRWMPRPHEAVAKLSRKYSRQSNDDKPLSRYRRVTSVTPVDPVPVRCIGIDTPDHLFLAGRHCVPTHNTANTWMPCIDMARNSPVYDNYNIEPMETFINVPRGRIEAVTSAGLSREGFRPVATMLDQTESWLESNGGWRLARTIRRNTMKTGGMTIETPNAFEPGEESVAEQSWHAHQTQLKGKNRSRKRDLLLDHREASATTDVYDHDSLYAGLLEAYGDSAADNGGWVNVESVIDEYYDPNTDPQEARRYFLNQITHASDSFLSAPELAACVEPKAVKPGSPIVLGFDGSEGRSKGKADATALVAVRLEDGYAWQVLIREPPNNPKQARDWTAPVFEFDMAVQQMHRDFKVVAFYADPTGWEAMVSRWEEQFGRKYKFKAGGDGKHPIMAWPRSKTAQVVHVIKRLKASVLASGQARTAAVTSALGDKRAMQGVGEFTYDGSFELTQHLLNARMRKSTTGYLLAKDFPESPRKIDGAYALVLAWKAYLDAVAQGLDKKIIKREVVTLG
jgi:LAGLIDADG-like domain